MSTGTVVIAGSLAQSAHKGGHTWVFLQYLLGFQRMNWDVLFLDRLEPEMCIDSAGQPCPLHQSVNLRYFLDVMNGFGLEGSYALFYDRGQQVVGLSRNEVLARTKQAALMLNVMGFFNDVEVAANARCRVFLDIDPGFGQMWQEMGLADLFQGHDYYVTIGENIGTPDCPIPTCGLDWITTAQPVALDFWPAAQIHRDSHFTSIGAWRGIYGPLDYCGRSYGLRAHEFRKFVGMPRLSGQPFEIALDIDTTEVTDLARLAEGQWSLVDPQQIACDPWAYRLYIQKSKAEFMVAKNMYVQSNSGWFSDRSICYLASSKPVLAQDTGIRRLYATGEGLLVFSTLEEALAGVAEINGNYDRHARAARDLAREYFDSDRILGRLLAKLAIA